MFFNKNNRIIYILGLVSVVISLYLYQTRPRKC